MSEFVSMFIVSTLVILFFVYRAVSISRQFKQIQAKLILTEQKLAEEMEKYRLLNEEVVKLKKQIETSIMNDTLTGLPNRRLFEDRLSQTLIQSKRYHLTFAILFLDLDGFKVINEALGLDAGDAILKQVVERLLTGIRRMDSVSRFSGDTFVFLLPQLAKPETAAYVAQRLLDSISEPFQINEQEIFITASIGIAIYPTDGDEMATLLKNADHAIHQAKTHGRNNYQFYRKEVDGLSRRELVLSTGLRSSDVYQNFLIYYQPWIDTNNKKIICMESSLCWQHPDFGLLPFKDFLRIAEDCGIIMAIGDWLLRGACKQFQVWKEQGFFPDTLAVNVSLRQLENPHFSYKLSLILQELNIEPANLILEVSESMLLAKSDMIIKNLQILNRLGVQMGISDFGTGNVALQQLKSFPMSYLKIATSLVKDMTIDKECAAIVNMILALGKTLQLKVIADGVESEKQKQMLNEIGCTLMQGDMFSPPILATEVGSLLEKSKTEKV